MRIGLSPNCYSPKVVINQARFVNFESGPSERARFVAIVSNGYSLRTLPDVGLAFWSAAVLGVALTRAMGSPSSLQSRTIKVN